MFFISSKVLTPLTEPFSLGVTLLALALLLRLLRRGARLRRAFFVAGGATLLLFSLPVVADALLGPLESRTSRGELPRSPVAIVLLSGMVREAAAGSDLMDTADRLVEAVVLAHRFPRARLLISGGSSALLDSNRRESDVLARLTVAMGIARGRLLLDREARNTRENAVNSVRLADSLPAGPLVLVTSAFHMPRSLACFRKLTDRPIIPWPVDPQREPLRVSSFLPAAGSYARARSALHEYVGLLAYQLAGYL